MDKYPPIAGHKLLGAAILCILLCILILLAGCTSTAWRNVAIGASVVDMATTKVALDRGYQEANVLYSKQPIQRGIVLNLTLFWGLNRAMSHQPEGVKRPVWATFALVRLLPVVWNVYQLSRPQPAGCR